jgi:hypothetical protein
MRVFMRIMDDNTANITRSQRTGTRGAVFCPKDEKNITPAIMGMRIIQSKYPV